MKKLISCLLAVLLVCSLMSMSVFADNTPVVGTHQGNNNVNDGVDDFTSSNGNGVNADINVNFGQENTKGEDTDGDGIPDTPVNGGEGATIVHKYAVDITYGEFMLDLTKLDLGEITEDTNGDGFVDEEDEPTKYYMVWDVNNYKYVLCKKVGENNYVEVELKDENGDLKDEVVDADEDDVADVLETPFTLDSKVTVTNHSDLSVFTKLVLTNGRTDIDWEITAAKNNGEKTANVDAATDTATEEITKATAATDTANGEATNGSTYSFTATPAAGADGWLGVIGNLLNEANTVVIGNITVTIAKDAASLNA